jgi:phage gpG-like protein
MSQQGGSVWPVTHQEGTSDGFGRGITIPQRKMWDLDEQDRARSENIIQQEVSRLYGF